jgi:hypothetical protein
MKMNLAEIDPVEEGIPTGRYLAELIYVKEEYYKYFEGSKVVWHWSIVKGREEGKEILSNSSTDQEHSYRIYKHLQALGVRGNVRNLDLMTLLGRKAVLEIESKKIADVKGEERDVPYVKRVFPPDSMSSAKTGKS